MADAFFSDLIDSVDFDKTIKDTSILACQFITFSPNYQVRLIGIKSVGTGETH